MALLQCGSLGGALPEIVISSARVSASNLRPEQQCRRSRAGGDHAMTNNSTKSVALQSEAETAIHVLDDWFDPIEAGLRDRVREFIQAMIEGELEAALSRPRYARRPKEACENADGASGVTGHRHGHRLRSLLGTFGSNHRYRVTRPRFEERLMSPPLDDPPTEKSARPLPAQMQKSADVDLPLRLDDADASPTTPQGQQLQAVI